MSTLKKAVLDEFEQLNIEDALQWVLGRIALKPEAVFSEHFIRKLHRRMYAKVWTWAGKFRKTDKNIGVPKEEVATALRMLCEEALFWFRNETFSPDEIAVRFKHRLVSIHCFPNGNGRHSRLMADIIAGKLYDGKMFSWGAGNLVQTGELRSNYLQALRAADAGDYALLLAFSRA